jgi:type IV secretory pathway ATPase VirB11/archaellum biosynthesis ATPase
LDVGPDPGRLAALVRGRVLDAELAALLWLLAEARLPLVVAGEPRSLRTVVRAALIDLLPAGTRTIVLRGQAEVFDWLPEAAELGWRRDRSSTAAVPGEPASPATTVLIADLEDRPPGGTWGEQARVAIRAVAVGYGMAATTGGNRLEDVLGLLAAFPVAAIDDELTRLGVVLVLAADEDVPPGGRVAAAHYLRPVQRDVHGHVQRMPPAVLATWDPRSGRFEHFAWGIADELAGRTGRAAIELEREQARRAAVLLIGEPEPS